MFCFNTKGYKHTFCCPCCGNKMDKKALHNAQLKRNGEEDSKCSVCGEYLDENAGKYPQIVVVVVGSKKGDTKGFIASAIFKIGEFDNNLFIKLASETSMNAAAWDYNSIENSYKEYFEDEGAQYPVFDSGDSSDRATIQSYTFTVENRINKQNALLTIVEINERFLHGDQISKMQNELPRLKRILNNSGYVFFLLDPDDAKNPNYPVDMTTLKKYMGKDTLHAIICRNKPKSVYMNRDEFEVTVMEALLKENRELLIDELRLSERDKPDLYFMCSPEEHSDNNGEGNSLNCELPFYWILILDGIKDVFVSEHNARDKYNRIKSDKACWNVLKKRLYFCD